jgi:hypothetical protein
MSTCATRSRCMGGTCARICTHNTHTAGDHANTQSSQHTKFSTHRGQVRQHMNQTRGKHETSDSTKGHPISRQPAQEPCVALEPCCCLAHAVAYTATLATPPHLAQILEVSHLSCWQLNVAGPQVCHIPMWVVTCRDMTTAEWCQQLDMHPTTATTTMPVHAPTICHSALPQLWLDICRITVAS